jgi:hypothetical protein
MARTAYGKHSTQVDTATYPDDPNVPIGSDEWNASPSDSGMLGFNAETIASATSITPSNTVLNISGSTNVATITQGNTNEYDLLYIFTSGTVTLEHNTGNLKLISNSYKNLSTTIPTILIRKGTDWIEYGGGNETGTVMKAGIIPDTDNAYDIGSASYKIRDLYVSENSLWVGDDHKIDVSGGKMKFKKRKKSSVPAVITSGGGNTSGAKTHSGKGELEDIKLNEWVAYARSLGGSLASVRPNDIFRTDESDDWTEDTESVGKVSPVFTGTATFDNLTVNGTTTTINSTTLTVDDKNIELGSVATPTDITADGGGITLKGTTDKTITWNNATDSWTFNQSIDFKDNYMDIKKISAPSNPSADYGRIYIKQIDANNDGFFIKVKKGSSFVEIQIA